MIQEKFSLFLYSFHMIKFLLLMIFPFLLLGFFVTKIIFENKSTSGAPTKLVTDPPADINITDWSNWIRPDGPVRVGIQVGHWKLENLPDELKRLKDSTGSSGGGKSEWQVNYEIAIRLKAILEKKGIKVDLLSTEIPKDYVADAFISIHADGNENSNVSGFKVAGPRRDLTGNSSQLADEIETSYKEATGLELDPNISRNMTGYYAFAWWRFDHAVHPMTTSVIVETGFLSNPSDRKIIVNDPQLSAEGIAEGVLVYLSNKGLL